MSSLPRSLGSMGLGNEGRTTVGINLLLVTYIQYKSTYENRGQRLLSEDSIFGEDGQKGQTELPLLVMKPS